MVVIVEEVLFLNNILDLVVIDVFENVARGLIFLITLEDVLFYGHVVHEQTLFKVLIEDRVEEQIDKDRI